LITVALFELAAAPFRVQFDLISEILSLRHVRRCCIDAGGLGMQLAEQAVERFGGHRVHAVTFTPALKSQLAAALRIVVEARRIRIPDDERIRNDWHSVERTVTESGHFRLAARRTPGGHADRFWAAALAIHAADLGAGRVESLNVRPLHFARTGTW
jgi:phage FluMu gp28-like protein